MPRLADIQAEFAAAVKDFDRDLPANITSYSSDRPHRRFHIYRNNFRASLIDVLATRYQVVERLVGEEFFKAMSAIFIDRHPPRSPVILKYGGEFAAFLKSFEHAADIPYLPDVAQLEWLQNVAYHSQDAEALKAEDLAAIAPEAIAETRFVTHPSLGVLQSAYPVFSIWRTNFHDEIIAAIDVKAGGENMLVVRPGLDVVVQKLPLGAACLLAGLQDDVSFGQACVSATAIDADFQLDHALAQMIGAGCFVDFQLPNAA